MSKWLLRILRPSAFKIGALFTVAATVFYVFGVFFGGVTDAKEFVDTLNSRVFDSMQRISYHTKLAAMGDLTAAEKRRRLTSGQVVIIDIDEKSLLEPDPADPAKGGIGQWPWPRSTIAKILENTHAAGAKIIGLDMVFSETDRTSPKNYITAINRQIGGVIPAKVVEQVETDPRFDNDVVLSEVLQKAPVILGFVFQLENDGLKLPGPRTVLPEFDMPIEEYFAAPEFAYPLSFVTDAYRVTGNIPVLAESSLSQGFFNPAPDADGVVRRVPLLIRMDDVLYPCLGLEMLREGMSVTRDQVKLNLSSERIYDIGWDKVLIPCDLEAKATINFRGPQKTFPYFSAVDVLRNRPEVMARIKDKYVLFGTSAVGLRDSRTTPFDQTCPGVEVHANLIDNVLRGDVIQYSAGTALSINLLLLLFGGLVLSAILAYASPLAGGLCGFAFIISTIVGNYYFFFLDHVRVGTVYPIFVFFVTFIVVTLYNYLTEGRQKRQIRGAFSLYLSPAVVNQVAADPQALKLEGQQKELTVLFSDIRGFTSISEKMTPPDLTNFLNEYLTPMSDIVMNTGGGTVDKFMGDAVMAFWGAPLDDPDHAVHAARAALRMIEKLRELQPKWQERGLPPIDIGIGLNTGNMSVGNMGSMNRFDYTVMGDNVNLGSRLEGLNKAYGTNILISQSTRAAIGERFFCRLVDLATVKGKKEPVRIYELLREGAPAEALRREVADFETAIELYRRQRWDEAVAILQRLHAADPKLLYEIYLKRIAEYRENPPPAEWNGVYEHKTK